MLESISPRIHSVITELGLLKDRNFQLHWASIAISHMGGFFTLIALPWLVLSISGDHPIVLSTVLATVSIPNGFFYIFGGALADRFSPMKTLIFSRLAFGFVMASLALLTYASLVPLWLIYIYALILGTLGAVGVPASQSLLPTFVRVDQLSKANGIVMGTLQATQIATPAVAGWLIWLGRTLHGHRGETPSPQGLAFAFAIDALAAFLAMTLLQFMRVSAQPAKKGNIVRLLGAGIRFCWQTHGLRLVLGYLLLVSFFLHGPLLAALPLFIKQSLGLDERALGTLYSMLGLGTALGALIAMITHPKPTKLGLVVLCCDAAVGSSFYILGHVKELWVAGSLLLAMGCGIGVTMVAGTTWFQTRTPQQYMGRVMSLVMVSVQGFIPLSATICGLLIDAVSVEWMMSGAGLVIFTVAILGLTIPKVRQMGNMPAAASNEKHLQTMGGL